MIFFATVLFASSFAYGYAQPKSYPVLLVHGYNSDATIWECWESLLTNDGIPHKSVTFSGNDKCGSVKDHAAELKQIVKEYMKDTKSDKINIVTHSKRRRDTRLYLTGNMTNDAIANFIMIGTPNKGSPVEDKYYKSDKCVPASSDLRTDSDMVKSAELEAHNPHTAYYTIAGNWRHDYIPFTTVDKNCLEDDFNWISAQYVGSDLIYGPDYGLVPVWSAEIRNGYKPLGETDNCHTQLLNDESYRLAVQVLKQ